MGITGVSSEPEGVRGRRPQAAKLRAGVGGEEAVVRGLREGARGGKSRQVVLAKVCGGRSKSMVMRCDFFPLVQCE